MGQDEETKVQKFYGRSQDDYSLWRIRIEAAMDGKNYWEQIEHKDCPPDVKRKGRSDDCCIPRGYATTRLLIQSKGAAPDVSTSGR